MDTANLMNLLATLVSGMAGGLLVAIINHLFTRRKTHAETKKLEAEAEKLRVETQKLLTEMQSLSSTVKEVSYKLSQPSEQIIYDSTVYSDGSHFKGYGDRFWGESRDKPKGMGALKIENGIINITRTNAEGRFRVTLLNYSYDGAVRDYLPKNDYIAGKRQLKLSCEAKAINGTHTLLFIVKKNRHGDHLDRYEESFSRNEWIRVNAYFRIPPNEDCQLWIDDQGVSKENSSLQIRKLVLSEIGS